MKEYQKMKMSVVHPLFEFYYLNQINIFMNSRRKIGGEVEWMAFLTFIYH